MKILVIIIPVILKFQSVKAQWNDKQDTVSIIGIFDTTKATKGGYFFKDYILDIAPQMAAKIHGKKIKVLGKFVKVQGLPADSTKNDEALTQGRAVETKYLTDVKIEVLRESSSNGP